ncbi:MAG: helix-turn-helix domain-containing protein [Christensenellaceae bacterium]|nr:helix-turn-helix domain-containing protein [Christensenellaceae bacterium]
MREKFSKRLRELRRTRGMTQEQLAAKLGVTVQAVSKWETGASYPDIELVPEIAKYFDVSVDYLLRGDTMADNRCIGETPESKNASDASDATDNDGVRDSANNTEDGTTNATNDSDSSKQKQKNSMWDNGLCEFVNQTLDKTLNNVKEGKFTFVNKSGASGASSMESEPDVDCADTDIPDDNVLRVVLFNGNKMVRMSEYDPKIRIPIELCCDRNGIKLEIWGNADIKGNIDGDVSAGAAVNCGDIIGDVNACGSINSGYIHGDVTAGGSIDCDDIYGDLRAGGSVECGDVDGDMTAGGNVNCGNVGGDVRGGGSVECGDIDGDVTAGGNVNCGDVGGDVRGGGTVKCGDVTGDVTASKDIVCDNVGGDAHANGSIECGDIGGNAIYSDEIVRKM